MLSEFSITFLNALLPFWEYLWYLSNNSTPLPSQTVWSLPKTKLLE